MNMLRIGICDDMSDMRFLLRYKLERILEARAIESELFEFSSGDRLLGWFSRHAGELDFIFLDIEMEGSNGMETARYLRSMDKNLQLAFVTAHPDYVFDGYSVGALGYLMKPVTDQQLEDTLTRAMAALYLNAEEMFLCRSNGRLYRIPKASIKYFYSEKRLTTCVANVRNYTFYARLDEVAEEVGNKFVRIHQRYLVNPSAVKRIHVNEVLIDGNTLPISRAYQENAMLTLTRAMLR